jgi:hypothetical protein
MAITRQFFATKSDLTNLAGRIENAIPVKYVRKGVFPTPATEAFSHLTDIPNLGKAASPSAVACDAFLVCAPETIIKLRPLKAVSQSSLDTRSVQIGGKEFAVDKRSWSGSVDRSRFAIDQLENPDTIVLSTGGAWNGDTILNGSVGTASKSKAAQEWMNRFHSALKSEFAKIKAFYVGPEALDLLNRGWRLTGAVQSPAEFDLRL